MLKSRSKFKIIPKKKEREKMLVTFLTKKKERKSTKKTTHPLTFAISKSSSKFKVQVCPKKKKERGR
jgi:hypothetical protein